tara:strand:+ start:5165 stop:5422 length:258 start_codon:yes stop_codon:yes gene_type:complete
MSLNRDWESFLLNESLDDRNIFTYLQGLQEFVSNIKPRSLIEERRVQLAKEYLREGRRTARKMQNELEILQERLTILEESLNERS